MAEKAPVNMEEILVSFEATKSTVNEKERFYQEGTQAKAEAQQNFHQLKDNARKKVAEFNGESWMASRR